jgi:hypothetical protein
MPSVQQTAACWGLRPGGEGVRARSVGAEVEPGIGIRIELASSATMA